MLTANKYEICVTNGTQTSVEYISLIPRVRYWMHGITYTQSEREKILKLLGK